jgi:deazaflavin-dependent oxidoreductase (nitroreductase family)
MSQTTQTPTVPPFVNKAMKFVLSSPMHGVVSKTVLLITFTGRKSGKTYTTPVDYSQDGELVTIFTHANWWKNLRGGASVTLRMRGQQFQGLAEPVAEDKQAVAAGLTAHLHRVPSDAKYYGVTLDNQGNPNEVEVEKAAQTVAMIRVRLC